MQTTDNRRDGVRVAVRDDIEGIIFADDGFPDFCNSFIINMGGIRINSPVEHHQNNKISVCLFHVDGSTLTLNSELISSTPDKSILKFSPLTNKQRQVLQQMLMLQQAVSPTKCIVTN